MIYMVMRAHLKRTEAMKIVLEYLRVNGKGTAREISDATGLDFDVVVNTLKRQNGWTVKGKKEGPARQPKTWRLV